jgi:hypothetical protein
MRLALAVLVRRTVSILLAGWHLLALGWHYFFFFFAVFALCLNALAVGAPFDPGLRIFSGVLPAAFCLFMRLRFA